MHWKVFLTALVVIAIGGLLIIQYSGLEFLEVFRSRLGQTSSAINIFQPKGAYFSISLKTDRENFPSLNDESEPYKAIKDSFVSAESMNYISMSNPADFGLGYRIGQDTVTRVKLK